MAVPPSQRSALDGGRAERTARRRTADALIHRQPMISTASTTAVTTTKGTAVPRTNTKRRPRTPITTVAAHTWTPVRTDVGASRATGDDQPPEQGADDERRGDRQHLADASAVVRAAAGDGEQQHGRRRPRAWRGRWSAGADPRDRNVPTLVPWPTATPRTSASPGRSSASTASCGRRRGTKPCTVLPTVSGRRGARQGPTAVGFFSCSKSTNEMNFIAQKFARAVIGTQQHRLVQPHLTRALRGRSGHRVRSRRRHVVVPGDRGHRRHRHVGLQRP